MFKPVLFYVNLFFLITASHGFAQFGSQVMNTPHNLRKAATGSMAELGIQDFEDVCVYCHAPHNQAIKPQAILWNRNIPTTTYQLYDSPKLKSTVSGNLDSTSLGCLSCHDDTTPLDAVKDPPSDMKAKQASNVTISACSNTCHTGSNPGGGIIFKGNLGSDLRKHHPVGIRYDAARNRKLHVSSGGQVNGLPLFGSNQAQVGCATCHDPHDDLQRPFLRIKNQNGELCQACHNM